MLSKLPVFVVLLIGISNATADNLPTFVKDQHKTTLQKYLDQHPSFHIAPESLCDCGDDLSRLRVREPGFQPYYAVGDINDDGIEDFAVALLDHRKVNGNEKEFAVVVFHGPFSDKAVNSGIMVVDHYKIDRPQEILYVFKSRIEEGHRLPARLDIGPGPFGSDDVHVIIYDKKSKKYNVRYFYD